MTPEEMEALWPDCPPFRAEYVIFKGKDNRDQQFFVLTQEGIKKLKAYVEAIEESANG